MFSQQYLFTIFLSIVCFAKLCQTETDLIKGVLLGALIAKQKSGEKVFILPMNGDKLLSETRTQEFNDNEDEDMSTTTVLPEYMNNMNAKNSQIINNIKQMQEMIEQIVNQHKEKKSPQQQKPRQMNPIMRSPSANGSISVRTSSWTKESNK
ncbi:unnamed protein product [Medioppia subpectinata]|uniref:Uncharacterized protein n=1 Tax=Medioppia subpectinata TaxID=1979941 RepID=A0A7R9QJL0_9ACAR|nr:unnamed protein product [Medioppia subpectinata]CAG2121115.1 unnamed protein product [Medioppia subpectinata]